MSNVLRKYVRRILTEELNSITRANGDKEAWEIEWDGDKIKNARKIIAHDGKINFDSISFESDVDQEKIEAAQSAGEKFTTHSRGMILAKIIEVENTAGSPGVRAAWPGIEPALDIVKKYWEDSINWPKPDRTGRGEATMNMAFDSIIPAEEPDFRVVKGGESYSIKHFMKKTASVKNAGDPTPDILDALVELAKAMKTDIFLEAHGKKNIVPTNESVFGLFVKLTKITGRPKGGMQPVDFQQYCEDEKMAEPDGGFKFSKDEIKEALKGLKLAILNDHSDRGSKGMIVFRGWDPTNISFLPKGDDTSAGQLKIKAIRADSRVEFCLDSATTTFEDALARLGNPHRIAFKRSLRKNKKAHVPNEKDFDEFVEDMPIKVESRRRKVRMHRRRR